MRGRSAARSGSCFSTVPLSGTDPRLTLNRIPGLMVSRSLTVHVSCAYRLVRFRRGVRDVPVPEGHEVGRAAVVVIEPAAGIAVFVHDLRTLELEPELELVALAGELVRVSRQRRGGHVPVAVCPIVVRRVDRVVADLVEARVWPRAGLRRRRLERVVPDVPAVAHIEQRLRIEGPRERARSSCSRAQARSPWFQAARSGPAPRPVMSYLSHS